MNRRSDYLDLSIPDPEDDDDDTYVEPVSTQLLKLLGAVTCVLVIGVIGWQVFAKASYEAGMEKRIANEVMKGRVERMYGNEDAVTNKHEIESKIRSEGNPKSLF